MFKSILQTTVSRASWGYFSEEFCLDWVAKNILISYWPNSFLYNFAQILTEGTESLSKALSTNETPVIYKSKSVVLINATCYPCKLSNSKYVASFILIWVLMAAFHSLHLVIYLLCGLRKRSCPSSVFCLVFSIYFPSLLTILHALYQHLSVSFCHNSLSPTEPFK